MDLRQFRVKTSLAFVVLAALLLPTSARLAAYVRSATFDADESVMSCLEDLVRWVADAVVTFTNRRTAAANRLGLAADDEPCSVKTFGLEALPRGMTLVVSVAFCSEGGGHYRRLVPYTKKSIAADIVEARAFLERLEQSAAARCGVPSLAESVKETCQKPALCKAPSNQL